MDLEQIREFFKDDRFAALSGVSIDEVGQGYARCSMKIEDHHRNARGTVMGGAIFTLADLCFGAASEGKAVSMTSEINYLAPAMGPLLVAVAHERKNGRNTVFFQIDVKDGDRLVAAVTMMGFKI